MKKFKKYFTILFCFVSFHVSATVYYVSNSNGNDGETGTFKETAWKTIAKVNAQTFSPGDSILFNKNDIWRETLNIPSSGSSDNYIYFGTYGSGKNPAIYGSEAVYTWTSQGNNVWKSDNTFSNPHQNNADIHFINGDNVIWGHFRPDINSLASNYDWTWSSNYIYVYSTSDPGSIFTVTEIPQRYSCIDTYHKEYLRFDGIDVFFARYIGYDDNNSHSDNIDISGLIIENCEIAYIGGITTAQNGFGVAAVYSDLVVRNCTIHDCGRRGISLDIYGYGFTASNAIIENNTIYGGFHTTGIDLSVGSGGFTGSWNGVYIRNNTFSDLSTPPYIHASNQIFLQNWAWDTQNAKAENIYIYNNIFKTPNFSAINMEGMNKIFVYNNDFFEASVLGSYVVLLWIDRNNTNIVVKNNIFYCSNPDNNFAFEVFCLTDNTQVDIDYNLYYRVSNNLTVIKYQNTSYSMTDIKSALNTDLQWEVHSPDPADPDFISGTDLHLKKTSPCIGAGINVGLQEDHDGLYYNDPPSIGAYEGNPKSGPPQPPPTDSSKLSISVFPNPGTDMINVIIEGFDSSKQLLVRILDLSGHVFYEDYIEPGETQMLNQSFNLRSGAYVILVQDDQLNWIGQKFIII